MESPVPAQTEPSPPSRPPTGLRLDDDDWLSRSMLSVAAVFARYHRHRALHLERLGAMLERGRRVILVGNHVLDVVDPLLFVRAVHARFDVIPRGIAHPAWLRLPGLRDFARRYGVIAAREPDAAGRALRESGLLLLFPGAVREAALRDYRREPYRLKWKDRTGFLRLALEHDAEILFVAAVGTEDLYYQSRLRVPDPLVRYLANGDAARYRGMRLMVGVLGPHVVPAVLPFPAQITHVVSDPLDLGDRARALSDEATFGALHERVWDRCQTLLDDAVRARPADDSLADLGVRAGHAVLRRLGL